MKNCSICGQPYTGFGNNADPFPGRCCDNCDNYFVIPARLVRMGYKHDTAARLGQAVRGVTNDQQVRKTS